MKTFLNIVKYWGIGLLWLSALVIFGCLVIGCIGLFILLISSKSVIVWTAAALVVGGILGFIAYRDGDEF